MPVSNFPNGFVNGVNVRGMPVTQTNPGKIFWVNNSGVLLPGAVDGVDQPGESNGTFNRPFRTLNFAKGVCTANRGDIIVIMPGYTETITLATEIVMDKAGVAIVGLGSGSLRPTITFGAAAANIPITAANVSITNVLHIANFADVASAYTATGTATPTDFTVEGCEFRDTSSILNFIKCVTGNATSNSMDGFNFVDNTIAGLGTTAATTAISILSLTDMMTLSDNYIAMPALNDTPALATLSTFACLYLTVSGNRVWRPNTSSTGGTLFSGSGTCAGLVYDNYVHHLDATAGLMVETGTTLGFIENYCMITSAADKSALINPVAV